MELYPLSQTVPYASAYYEKGWSTRLYSRYLFHDVIKYRKPVHKTLKGPSDGGLCVRVVLYKGVVVSLRWPMEQPIVVTIDRWSLYASGL